MDVEKEETPVTRNKKTVIGAAAVAALAALVALLALLPETDVTNASTPSPGVTDDTVYISLIDERDENVLSVEFTPRDGPAYTIFYSAEEDLLTLLTANAPFPPKEDLLYRSFGAAIRQSEVIFVTDGADGALLESFGFGEPFMSVSVNLADGSRVEYETGIESALGSGRYVRRKGESSVYILKAYYSEWLSKSAVDFNNYGFLPAYLPPATDDEATYYAFTDITLSKSGRVIGVSRDAESDGDFGLVQPYEIGVNAYNLTREFLVPITNINPSELVEFEPSDLAKYGLDDPYILELTDVYDWTGALLIGKYDGAAGGRYVMTEGINAVLLDKADAYIFLDVEISRLRSGLIWSHMISDIAAVDFDLKGEKRRVEYTHHDDGTLTAELDGEDIGEQNGRRLYSSMLSVLLDGDSGEDIPNAPPDYTFTLTFAEDGSQRSLELYELNDRRYLIVLGGENLGGFTYVTTLRDKLLAKFEILDRGENLPQF